MVTYILKKKFKILDVKGKSLKWTTIVLTTAAIFVILALGTSKLKTERQR